MRITITGATGLIGQALVAELIARGDDVTVLSPYPSAAQWNEDLRSLSGIRRTIGRARRFDRVIVQFYPELFFSTVHGSRFYRQWLGSVLFFRLAGKVEVLAHETPEETPSAGSLRGGPCGPRSTDWPPRLCCVWPRNGPRRSGGSCEPGPIGAAVSYFKKIAVDPASGLANACHFPSMRSIAIKGPSFRSRPDASRFP